MRALMMAASIVAATGLAGVAAHAQQTGAPDLFRATPETYAPRYEPGQQHPPHLLPPLAFAMPLDRSFHARRSPSGTSQEPDGYLRLVVRPGTAQVYVDRFFVGTVDDHAASPGVRLEAGPHRVEIRANGYETAVFDVQIAPGAVAVLRENLVTSGASPLPTVPPPASPAAQPGGQRPLYVIPRCYAGDTQPRPEYLPAGCRMTDLRVVVPDR